MFLIVVWCKLIDITIIRVSLAIERRGSCDAGVISGKWPELDQTWPQLRNKQAGDLAGGQGSLMHSIKAQPALPLSESRLAGADESQWVKVQAIVTVVAVKTRNTKIMIPESTKCEKNQRWR